MKIVPITYAEAMEWCLKKHYARRKPMYQHSFAIVENGMVEGVVVYGRPPVQIEKAFKKSCNSDFTVYELVRLVVQSKTKNACSFLVGGSLKLLQKNNIVVSYADTAQGHSGIVYQATNWIYTGANKAHDSEYVVNGKKMHPKTITERYGITAIAKWAEENGVERIPPKEKHRYIYINADRKTKRNILSNMPYKAVTEYPKSEKTMYDDGDKIEMVAPFI